MKKATTVYYDGEPVQPRCGRTPEYIPEDVRKKLVDLETRLISKDHSSPSVMGQKEWNKLWTQ